VCTSIPIYLVLVIEGCSFLEKFEYGTQNLLQRAPFYNVFIWAQGTCRATRSVAHS